MTEMEIIEEMVHDDTDETTELGCEIRIPTAITIKTVADNMFADYGEIVDMIVYEWSRFLIERKEAELAEMEGKG